MFDDQQPKKAGNIPGNLPMGEPEDILAGSDDTSVGAGMDPQDAAAPPEPPGGAPTALGAGVLKPKNEPMDDVNNAPMSTPEPISVPERPVAPAPDMNMTQGGGGVGSEVPQKPYEPSYSQQPPETSQDGEAGGVGMTTPPPGMAGATGADQSYALKEPIGNKKTILWIVITVIVLVLGVGSVWIYMSFMRDGGVSENNFDIPETQDVDLDNLDLPASPTTPDVPETPEAPEEVDTTIDLEDQILFGEPVDTDGDDLDDVREADINTDPLNWDTDGDGLGDGAEVNVWKTDPLDADTDNDTYTDGAEIKNGYSPTGPGKLFELPTSTQGVDEASS
ncbi:hypothetical protein C0581_04535 [Candidatus Parcubacteria bacterium]|nr:MAG: hypothetical protein C0581_04535 [Candidatus Parcubacteria bacterium]